MAKNNITASHRLRFPAIALMVLLLWSVNVFANETVTSDIEISMFEKLASASSESKGRQAESVIWEYWFNLAPTADARDLLDKGRARRETYDYEGAETLFDQVVELAPEYFEGYNQRAFVRFLRENYSGALSDLEKTLELYPNHFGALSGMYHVLRVEGRHDTAMKMLRSAVTLHPWIQERSALPEAMWPDSYRVIHQPGQEI